MSNPLTVASIFQDRGGKGCAVYFNRIPTDVEISIFLHTIQDVDWQIQFGVFPKRMTAIPSGDHRETPGKVVGYFVNDGQTRFVSSDQIREGDEVHPGGLTGKSDWDR